jgi:hypothetical protein
MIDAFEQAFMAALDDLNAGRLHEDPDHYLRTVPAARHAEFTRRLSAVMVVRGGADEQEITAESYDAALSAVMTVASGGGSAGLLPDALRRLRKSRGIERDTLLDALAAEYALGPAGRDALRRSYHALESGALPGPGIAHRLLRSLARQLGCDGEDFIAAARAVVRPRPALHQAPAMARGAGELEQRRRRDPAAGRPGRRDPDVELVERLFTGGPDA